MFYLASFVKSVTATVKKHGVDTWQNIWTVLVWSFLAAWEGKHPSLDWENKPFGAGVDLLPVLGKHCAKGLGFWYGI